MKLDHVIEVLLESLKDDQYIEAVFLRGSMAREEHDEFSDIDIYCVVNEENVEAFCPIASNILKLIRKHVSLMISILLPLSY